MKNQYFGDINDYKKYGLLRLLCEVGHIKAAVCWMLTPNDLRPDGHRINYLQEPEKWSNFDPTLYRFLRQVVIEKRIRDITTLENSNIIPHCVFYSDIIRDQTSFRERYFERFLDFSHGAGLVFFDPDNGMEVNSIPFGRKNSSKYLYWREVERTFLAGHSVLVYQHLPPKPRKPFTLNLANKFKTVSDARCVYLYHTQFVVFFLVPQRVHEALLVKVNQKVAEIWGEEIRIEKHKLT